MNLTFIDAQGTERSLGETVQHLMQRVSKLEEENIGLTNELYEVQCRLDKLTDPYRMTYQDAIAQGWKMTADGFWFQESK